MGLYKARDGEGEEGNREGKGKGGVLALTSGKGLSWMALDAKQRTPLDVANEMKKESVAMYLEVMLEAE